MQQSKILDKVKQNGYKFFFFCMQIEVYRKEYIMHMCLSGMRFCEAQEDVEDKHACQE